MMAKKKTMKAKSMKVKDLKKCREKWNFKGNCCNCSTGAVYCLGFIGAAVYNISVTAGFWAGLWGVLKALVWPAFVVYKLMQFLGM